MTLLDDHEDDTGGLERIRAFEVAFILVVGTEYWVRAIPRWHELAGHSFQHIGVATILCLAALWTPWRRVALGVLGLSHALLVWRDFPATGNHAYLEVVFCLLAALLDPAVPGERRLYLRSVRWIAITIFFFSGLQKLAHGFWVHGQYLAFSIGAAPAFRSVVGFLVAPAEYVRLAAYRGEVGNGPYLVESWPLLLVSNATWVLELLLAPLLLWPRTRRLAACLALALLAGIELAAREVFFGMVFVNAVLLFLPATVGRRAVGGFVALLAILVLSRVGVLPEMTFY